MTGGEKGRKQLLQWKWTHTLKKTVWRKMRKPMEFFSLLCFVFFIYKKGKHQKRCLNTEGEIAGGSAIFLNSWTCLNVCSTHARWSDLWPLACPTGSPCSGRRLTILECFIASLYSISWQDVSHLIFPQLPVGSPNSSCENVALYLSMGLTFIEQAVLWLKKK